MNSVNKLTCFKAYDVRGKLGEEFNEDIAYRIGRAIAQAQQAKAVAVGFDARATSPDLAQAVAKGICDAGADVLGIGLAGTEEVYAAVPECDACAGIEVTASHNPIDYNGMKIVGRGAQPLSEQEFGIIKTVAEESNFLQSQKTGVVFDKKEAAVLLTSKKFWGLWIVQTSSLLKLSLILAMAPRDLQ